MATARFETVICFAKHNAMIRIECKKCHHVRTVQPRQLAKTLGWTTGVKAAERRLICSICGNKNAKLKPVPAQLS